MKVLNVFTPGHLDPYDSYGLIACELTRHLARLGAYVNVFPCGDRVVAGQPEEVTAVASQPILPTFGGFLLGYPTTYGNYGPLAAMGPRLAVTMFESSEIPPEWPAILNQLDGVIVPSQFCLEVFSRCGVEVPIHVVPLGISEVYQPGERVRKAGDPFTFLALADRGRRKGFHHALNAFLKAFGDDPNYRLILKARKTDNRINITNPNIDFIQQDMTEAEMRELFLTADCLVNPNLGEGFGLLPREFAGTGGLSLATNWGGTADDIEEWGLPIDYTLTAAWPDYAKHAGLGVWAEPDIDELATLMGVVAETADKWRPIAFERAHKVHQLYSWENFARAALEIWENAADRRMAATEAAVTAMEMA